MENNEVEILLVEDNLSDAELTMRSFKQNHLTSKLIHLRDGAEALDFIFGKGQYEGRNVMTKPKVILLDLKMPLVGGIEVL
jgi:two-component system response regulator